MKLVPYALIGGLSPDQISFIRQKAFKLIGTARLHVTYYAVIGYNRTWETSVPDFAAVEEIEEFTPRIFCCTDEILNGNRPSEHLVNCAKRRRQFLRSFQRTAGIERAPGLRIQ